MCGAIFFSNRMSEDGGGKHVKVKKRQRQNILRFRADVQKLILGSTGTPFDHLSVKKSKLSVLLYSIIAKTVMIKGLRGYCTPDQFFDCLCIFLKNYNTLVTSKICFL